MGLIAEDALPSDPLDVLRELRRSEAELYGLRLHYVAVARAAEASWEEVGEALGITSQSAKECYTPITWEELDAIHASNMDLSEEEAMEIAVKAVKEYRRELRHRSQTD